MLNEMGEKIIGHGVIKEFDFRTLYSQLEKRAQNPPEYNKRVLEEFEKEQPELYKLLERLVDSFSREWCNYAEIEGTQTWDDCFCFWKERLMFLLALQYKLVSLGVEGLYMERSLDL